MNTAFALLARFGSPIVALEEVCVEYFGMDKDRAYHRAKLNKLPVPTFRAIDRQKAPRFVHLDDLAGWLESNKAFPVNGSLAAEAKETVARSILAAAVPLKGPEGVYFLIAAGVIVYVGQSIDINRRLHVHRRSGRKFDSYSWIAVAGQAERLRRETELIRMLRPDWNKSGY